MRILLDTHAVLWWLTHRDPFDRMLAAQAAQGDYRIASVDTAFDLFGVERVW